MPRSKMPSRQSTQRRGVDTVKLRALLAAATLVLAAPSCGEPSQRQLHAGAVIVDITPQVWPLPMIGSFRYRPAHSAHDPLHSRALVLADGTETLAIAAVDSCYVPGEPIDEVKHRVQRATGLDTDRILVAATHTHSAPPPALESVCAALKPKKTARTKKYMARN